MENESPVTSESHSLQSALDALARTQEALLQQQELSALQSQQIAQLHAQSIATLYLGYALAGSHSNPKELADRYLSLMDHAGDQLPPAVAEQFRPQMQVVLNELLTSLQKRAS